MKCSLFVIWQNKFDSEPLATRHSRTETPLSFHDGRLRPRLVKIEYFYCSSFLVCRSEETPVSLHVPMPCSIIIAMQQFLLVLPLWIRLVDIWRSSAAFDECLALEYLQATFSGPILTVHGTLILLRKIECEQLKLSRAFDILFDPMASSVPRNCWALNSTTN
ncbi:hypothetical protein DL96DRAFT_214036 [Flagelloscypha sp. PMI_526]|nr:hypothetical protein DL96DRAFT_214036 [Flagelloscypha sp. PMI_526]